MALDPKVSATKAHAAAISTLIVAVLAYFGVGEMPGTEELATALQTTAGLVAYGASAAVTAGIAWVATYFARNKPIQSSLVAGSLALAIMLGLAACGQYATGGSQEKALSAEQLAFKVNGDLQAMQVGALAIVENAAVPAEAKAAVRAAEAVAYDAVTAYVEAARSGSGDLATIYTTAVASLTRLFDVLTANGWMDPDMNLFGVGAGRVQPPPNDIVVFVPKGVLS